MQFSLDGSGWMGSGRARSAVRIQDGAGAGRERLNLSELEAETAPAGRLDAKADAPERAARLIAYAALLREIVRRSGRVETLARAAAAAARARREAGSHPVLRVHAMLEQALVLRLGSTLFGDEDAALECAGLLDLVEGTGPDPLVAARVRALRASLSAAAALAWNGARQGEQAAQSLSAAAAVLTRLGADEADVVDVRLDRADLLIGLGERRGERGLLKEAEAELHQLTQRLDPTLMPLSAGRAATLRGRALLALGETSGDPAAIAEAVCVLSAAVADLPLALSPLDGARAGHALGLALQSMGEACDEEALFDRAVEAFSPALEALDEVRALPFRAVAAHDGAACLARRAERRGDLKALEQAERVFRDALKARNAAADPLAWAVTQVALARIYEAQSLLRRDTGERADAAFALAAALDVFAERGMRSLSDSALVALNRLKQLA